VGAAEEDIRLAGHELAAALDPAAGLLDCNYSLVDVSRGGEARPEVLYASRIADVNIAFLEDKDVSRSRGLCLYEMWLAINGEHTEEVAVELEGPHEIGVRQP